MTVDQYDTIWLTVAIFGYVVVFSLAYNNGLSLGSKG